MIRKNIDLCGLGNGLVDLLYEVSFELLDSLGLRKGEMRLVDSNRQKELFEKLQGLEYRVCSGGSAANTIIAFTQFGGKTAYHTVLGDDEFGHFYSEEFEKLGISLFAPHIPEPTGTCIVLITPDSERTMNTSLGATAHFGIEHINESFIKEAKWIYLEGYKFSSPKSTEALFHSIELAKKYSTKIALTVSDVFIISNFFDNVIEVARKSDLLFCNEYESKVLTESKTFEQAVERLKLLSKNFVITRGENGSYAYIGNKEYRFSAYPTRAIDTTGAGDMYAGAFLFGFVVHKNLEYAGRIASFAASEVVSQFGARLRTDHLANLNKKLIELQK
ncbi:MAG: adenosine kinase [Ignavibacteria bacterium]|nr:adenosine kinase [Ignavibacteria bacterium]